MIRFRKSGLKSGTSALAMFAIFGLAGSASAGTTVTGPGIAQPVHNSSNTDFVVITGGASVLTDPSGNSFTNDPLVTIDSTGNGVLVNSSGLTGNFVNQGSILGDDHGIRFNTSTLSGRFTNSGLITGETFSVYFSATNVYGGITNSGRIIDGDVGLFIFGGPLNTLMEGGIVNSGTISGDGEGIYMSGGESGESLTFRGGISNSGLVTGDTSAAIRVRDDLNFQGGITNTSSGKILSEDGHGIHISNPTFAGGITNTGTIAGGTTNSGHGIFLGSTTSTFAGGITNSGLIDSGGESDGIHIEADTFEGGIANSGTVTGAGDAIEITDDVTTFDGGIHNSSLMQALEGTGIQIGAETFNGGIDNSGTIDADNSGIVIGTDTDQFRGGITNSGLIRAVESTGIGIFSENFSGGITNSGTIIANSKGITGIVDEFSGGITNSGTITANNLSGISFLATDFHDGITNSGLIDAADSGISIGTLNFDGGIINSGTILAGTGGISAGLFDSFTGGVHNSGLIDTDSEAAIYLIGTTFDGGITNTGEIIAHGSAVSGVSEEAIYASVATFTGGIFNSGIINAEDDNAIRIFADVFDGGITNTGSIYGDPYGSSKAAIYLSINEFNGGISNSGLIQTGDNQGGDSGQGIYFTGTSFDGGINNSGTVVTKSDNGTSILVEAVDFDGGFRNSGLIHTESSGDGVRFDLTNNFAGGVTNTGTILADSTGIDIAVDQTFANGAGSPGFFNSGRIISDGAGVHTSGNTFNDGFVNTTTGSIVSQAQALSINNTSFAGGINNAGYLYGGEEGIRIRVTNFTGGITSSGRIEGVGADGIDIQATNFSGGISNSGFIQGAPGSAIDVEIDTFNGGVRNTGTLLGNTGGVSLEGTIFNGGFFNSGSIHTEDDEAVFVGYETFNGGFTNSGFIDGVTGVEYDVSVVTGGFTNSGKIIGGDYGAYLSVGAWASGNFTNSGTIQAGENTGLYISTTTFTGNVVNSGTISSDSDHAVYLSISAMTGGVTNSGLIKANTNNDALHLGVYMTGNVVNSGTIDGGTQEGIQLDGTIAGFLTNSGLIINQIDNDAIEINSGRIAGGIFNSGTIWSAEEALDLNDADSGHIFTQTAGLTFGDITSSNGYADIFNMNGGAFEGDIFGGETIETLNVNAASAAAQGTPGTGDEVAAGSFAYLRGTVDGLDELNINSGTAVLGSNLVGVQGAGVQIGAGEDDANSMIVKTGAIAYLDDDTYIELDQTYRQQAGAEVEFLLSRAGYASDFSETTSSGQIFADGTIFVDGTITGVVDLEAFGLGDAGTQFTYNNVFQSNSAVVGTFDNVGVLDDLLFFDIQAFYDSQDIDLVLTRKTFADGLSGASQSENQAAVGAVLDGIYDAANFSSGDAFHALFTQLLGSSDAQEALALYDQILGAEHAQAGLGSLQHMFQFQNLVGERMDVLHGGMNSAEWALFGNSSAQTALAATIMTDATPATAMGSERLARTRNENSLSIWGGVHGNWSSVDGDENGPGFDQDTFGLSAGVDYALSPESILGFGGAYMNSDLDFKSANNGDVDTFALGGYGTFGMGGGYLDLGANVAFHDVSSERHVPGPLVASAEYDALTWSLSGELGTVIPVGRAYVQPLASFTYTGLSTDGFQETGAGLLNLIVDPDETDSFASILGARAGDYFKLGRATVNLQGNLGWRHEFGDDVTSFTGAFTGAPADLFNVHSSSIAEDSATFGAGATVMLSGRVEVFLNYDGLWNAEADSHNGSLGLRANW